jgi:hypothetical protein
MKRTEIVLLAHHLVHRADQRAQLPLVVSGRDHKIVSNRRDLAQVQHHDILAFSVLDCLDNRAGQLRSVQIRLLVRQHLCRV